MNLLARVFGRLFFNRIRVLVAVLPALMLLAGLNPGPGGLGVQTAQACAPCDCVAANHDLTREVIFLEHGLGVFYTDPQALAYTTAHECDPGIGTRGWIAFELCRHREEFLVFYWFKEMVLAALMMMTEQLVSMAMSQMLILGTFFDAQQQLETQLVFQTLAARAHKDYHPSFNMCEIGTLSRSLAASQRRGEYNAWALSQHLQDRQMRNVNMASAAGKGLDVVHRWEHWRATFCNLEDNDGELGPRTTEPICTGETAVVNRDVDYAYLVGYPNTIQDVNFTDGAVNLPEQAVFGLAANLYGNDVFAYFPETYFLDEDKHDEYVYVRSIVAKRSVAQNTFNAIVGMKAEGTGATEEILRPYMERVLEQMGMENVEEMIAIIGERPSYYAQMEFLTKKLYQRPEFYTQLYDKPVNVERTKAAMKALGLVQKMDMFKSKLRGEAALAVLTEMEIYKAQDALQDDLNDVDEAGLRE